MYSRILREPFFEVELREELRRGIAGLSEEGGRLLKVPFIEFGGEFWVENAISIHFFTGFGEKRRPFHCSLPHRQAFQCSRW